MYTNGYKRVDEYTLMNLVHTSSYYDINKIKSLKKELEKLEDIINNNYREEHRKAYCLFTKLSDINCKIVYFTDSGMSIYAALIEVVKTGYCNMPEAIMAWNYYQMWQHNYVHNVNHGVIDALKSLGMGARSIYNRLNACGCVSMCYSDILSTWRDIDKQPTLFITDRRKELKKRKY